MRLRVGAPGAHFVRVVACILLDRSGRAAVRIAFAQHRVHRTAQHFGVARADFLLRIRLGIFRKVGDVVPFSLQFLDRGLQLRRRGTDVGQLDDVRFRPQGQRTQLGQVVGDFLVGVQVFREVRQDASGKGDIAGFNRHSGRLGEGLHDRQQGVGCQCGCLVGQGVNDFLFCHVFSH